MNIITWANAANAARTKIEGYFATFNGRIEEVEQAAPIRGNFIYDSKEFQDIIERAMVNP